MGFFSRFFRKLFEPTPDKKGAIGEYEIALAIWKEIRRGLKGYYLQNLYLPKGDGSTSEIDLLLISTKGLFLIESKKFRRLYFWGRQKKRLDCGFICRQKLARPENDRKAQIL